MKPAKIAVIGVAAISAIGLALVVRSMGNPSAQEENAQAVVEAAPVAKVLVAAVDLEPGRRLTASDMMWRDWPLADVNPAFITDGAIARPVVTPAATQTDAESTEEETSSSRLLNTVVALSTPTAAQTLAGSVVREPILAGEPIQARKIVRADDSGFMAAFLDPGMRAMSIPVSVESAAGGFILPGDRVDVVLTREVEVPNPASPGSTMRRNVSALVIQNLKVLAIDQSVQVPADETAVVGATATLEVNTRDAETLALSRAEGTLSLLLRSYADSSGPRGAIPGAVRRGEVSARRVSADGTTPEGPSVRIFRGNAAPDVVVLP